MRGDTEVEGLYMAGQDAWTPAVAGAMYGGLLGSIKVLPFIYSSLFLLHDRFTRKQYTKPWEIPVRTVEYVQHCKWCLY